jgi:hypothetical protein
MRRRSCRTAIIRGGISGRSPGPGAFCTIRRDRAGIMRQGRSGKSHGVPDRRISIVTMAVTIDGYTGPVAPRTRDGHTGRVGPPTGRSVIMSQTGGISGTVATAVTVSRVRFSEPFAVRLPEQSPSRPVNRQRDDAAVTKKVAEPASDRAGAGYACNSCGLEFARETRSSRSQRRGDRQRTGPAAGRQLPAPAGTCDGGGMLVGLPMIGPGAALPRNERIRSLPAVPGLIRGSRLYHASVAIHAWF